MMSDKIIENNQVSIMGEVVSTFTFSHEVFGEGFYMLNVSVKRLSESCDVIPLMISERLIDVNEDYRGAYIRATGQFRSYNRHEEKKNRLVLSVFVRELEFTEEELENSKTNQIFLDGYILQENSAGKGDCGYFIGSQPALWQIRLHPLHLLGEKCPFCIRF